MRRAYGAEVPHMKGRVRIRYVSLRRSGSSHEEALALAVKPTGRPRNMELDVEFEQDLLARIAIQVRPGGFSYDEIASLYGVSDQLIRNVETSAIKKVGQLIKSGHATGLIEHAENL